MEHMDCACRRGGDEHQTSAQESIDISAASGGRRSRGICGFRAFWPRSHSLTYETGLPGITCMEFAPAAGRGGPGATWPTSRAVSLAWSQCEVSLGPAVERKGPSRRLGPCRGVGRLSGAAGSCAPPPGQWGEFVDLGPNESDEVDLSADLLAKVQAPCPGNVFAQGDVSMQSCQVFEDLITDPIRRSSLKLLMKDSANVHGRRILMQSSQVITDIVEDGTSDSKIHIELEDSAQVLAETDFVMAASAIVGEVLDGFEPHRNTSFAFVARNFGTVVAGGAVSLESSSMVRELTSSSLEGSTALFKLERAFTVEAAQDFKQVSSDGLVNMLVRSAQLLEGSDVTIAAEHSLKVKAEAVAMNSSRLAGTGLSVDSLSNSSVSLSLKDTAGVEAKRVEMRQSSLLGSLFGPSAGWENARLRLELDDAASLEEVERALLVGSSLLASLGSLDALELSIHESALAICDGEKALLALENSTLCEDGAKALRAAAKPFKESCEALSCRQA